MIGWRLPPAVQQLGGGYVAQVSIKYGWVYHSSLKADLLGTLAPVHGRGRRLYIVQRRRPDFREHLRIVAFR